MQQSHVGWLSHACITDLVRLALLTREGIPESDVNQSTENYNIKLVSFVIPEGVTCKVLVILSDLVHPKTLSNIRILNERF